MPTPQKEAVVKEMADKFSTAKSIFLADFSGVDVQMITELRKGFREADVEYRVVKNTLAKLSLQKAGIKGLDNYLTGVNGYVISYDDPTQPSKVVEKYKKELNKKFSIKAAYFEGEIIGSENIGKLAKLPNKKELLGQFVGMIMSPMTKFVRTINAPMTNFAGVAKSVQDTKDEE